MVSTLFGAIIEISILFKLSSIGVARVIILILPCSDVSTVDVCSICCASGGADASNVDACVANGTEDVCSTCGVDVCSSCVAKS